MTGSELYDYIVRTFKRTDKSTEVYEAITDTVFDLRRNYQWEAFKDEAYVTGITTLGDYTMPLPSDFQHLTNLRLINGDTSYPLQRLNKVDFDYMFPNQNSSTVTKGKPNYYCIFHDYILLGVAPDDITYQYEISYAAEDETDIIAGTTSVPFTPENREVVKQGTLMRLYLGLGNDGEAVKWRGLYEESIREAMKVEEENTDAVGFTKYKDV